MKNKKTLENEMKKPVMPVVNKSVMVEDENVETFDQNMSRLSSNIDQN